MLKIHVYTIL